MLKLFDRTDLTLYYIEAKQSIATGGVLVDPKGIIIYTPPYFRFLIGRSIEEARKLGQSLHAVHEGNGIT